MQLRLVIGLIIITVLGSLFALWRVAIADLDAMTARYGKLESAHAVTVGSFSQMRDAIDESQQAVRDERVRRLSVETHYEKLMGKVNEAPENGCVGPAVRGVLDGLRSKGPDNSN